MSPCRVVDEGTVVLDVTNSSAEQSSYLIDVEFLDGSGRTIGAEPFFVNSLRPGERSVEPHAVLDSGGGASCTVADVERSAAPSADPVSDVTRETDGVDIAGDVHTNLTATNTTSEPSNYFVTAALVRDGVRIGTSFGSIENVQPGAAAPAIGFSTTDGPDDGIVCEVVQVERVASPQ